MLCAEALPLLNEQPVPAVAAGVEQRPPADDRAELRRRGAELRAQLVNNMPR